MKLEDMEIGTFHWSAGWFFKRLDDGSVRIVKVDGDTVVAKAEIPAAEWASILSSVCARGENGHTYRTAVAFHAGPPIDDMGRWTDG